MVYRICCFVALAAGLAAPAVAATLQEATLAFVSSLNAEQKAATVYAFNSEERLNWHFIPKKRLGVSFKELSPEQDAAMLDVVRAGLSESGLATVETIRGLENVLHEIEGAAHRDPELYTMLIFGDPSGSDGWSVRYEGHHVSLNWTFVGGELASSSPQFLGANPGEVRIEGAMKGTRALGAAEDLGRSLVKALDAEHRAKALVNAEAPNDILTSNRQMVEEPIENPGIAYSDLGEAQQGMLLSVIEELARVQTAPVARKRLDDIREAGLENIRFTWMGGLEPGDRHYYSVEGPTFLVEYDNTQNDANHVHTVWRDYTNDFGADVLKEHYATAKHASPLLRTATR